MNQDLQHSLIILKRISNQLNNAENALQYIARQMHHEYNQHPINDAELFNTKSAMYCIVYYLIMWYSSFLEEYERLPSRDPGVKTKTIDARRNAKEYLDTLEIIFGDIRDIRNKILAHPYRMTSNSGATPLSDDKFNELHDKLMGHPNINPYTQIPNCIKLIIQALEQQFGEIDETQLILFSSATNP